MKCVFIVGVFVVTFIVSDWATDKVYALIKKSIKKHKEKKIVPVEELLAEHKGK